MNCIGQDGRINNGGARVGAGRKPKLETVTIERIKRFAASTLLKLLRDVETPLNIRAEISKSIFLRSMPQKLEVDQNETKRLEIMVRLENMNEEDLKKIIEVGRKNTSLLTSNT